MRIIIIDDDKLIAASLKTIIETSSNIEVISLGYSGEEAIELYNRYTPDILLMDEPFSALDALTREEAQELFINIWNQYKLTTLFITHNIEEAIYMGKKIVIMSHCPGTIVEIIDNPLFNTENLREDERYLKLSSYLRSIIKRGWKI